MQTAEQIAKKAKSNLAIALLCLPKNRRQDMVTFYAFCRLIDDIADTNTAPEGERHDLLDRWAQSIQKNDIKTDLSPLQPELLQIIDRHKVDKQHVLEIIEGCRSDISNIQTFKRWEDLKKYTFQVASCVGLVSIRIFGCKNEKSSIYAENLGHALQITNIIRDVGDDLENGGRIYLPLEELKQFSYSEQDLRNHTYNEQFVSLMKFQASRAEEFYTKALDSLPTEDEKALKPSESMRKIYSNILDKMKQDDFQVFTKRYKLSRAKKIFHLLTSLHI